MRSRQDADFALDIAELLGVATVDPFPLEDQLAHHALFQMREGGGNLFRGILRFLVFRQEFGEDLVAQLADLLGTLLLTRRLLACPEFVAEALLEDCEEWVRLRRWRILLGVQTRILAQLLDRFNDRDDVLMAKENRLEHALLGHLASKAL